MKTVLPWEQNRGTALPAQDRPRCLCSFPCCPLPGRLPLWGQDDISGNILCISSPCDLSDLFIYRSLISKWNSSSLPGDRRDTEID